VGDRLPILVSVQSVILYRDRNGSSGEVRRASTDRERVGARVLDTSIATVSPGEVNLRGGRPGTLWIEGKKPGRTRIVYEDVLYGEAVALEEEVIVQDCHWELSMTSVWRPQNVGFTPTILGAFINLRLKQPSPGNTDVVVGTLSTTATAPPIGGCTITYDVNHSDVSAYTSTDATAPRMEVELIFEPIQASISVCGFGGVSGGTSDSGTLSDLTFTIDMTRRIHTINKRQSLFAAKAGTWVGTTTLRLIKVPGP